MTSTKTLTPELRLTVVKHLAKGKAADIVATIAGLPRATVIDIGSHHGYLPVLARASRSSLPAPASAVLAKPDEIHILINTAKAHPSKRIQAAGDRLFDQVDKLRELIREDEEKHAERRKAAAAKEAARAEVKRLEQQLADARAKLRGKTTTKPTASDGPSSKEIREWATSAGIECPTVGRVPAPVRAAYEEAQVEQEAS